MVETQMDDNKIRVLANEYGIDYEVLIECLAQACRKLYGILEIDEFKDGYLIAYEINNQKRIVQKQIRLTNAGMTKIIKETARNVDEVKSGQDNTPKLLIFSESIRAIALDIARGSKTETKLDIISVREMSEKEKVKFRAQYYVVVRANRYLSADEKNYFMGRTKNLKQGVIFVLD